MTPPLDVKRRVMLARLASLPVAACAPSNAPGAAGGALLGQAQANRTLVAYLSRSGQTPVIGGVIERTLGADLFEIRTATPYPADYFETVEQANREREAGVRPTLAEYGPDLAGYDTLYLCFPVWGGTTPPPIRSYLDSHDLAGKTVMPVITRGGSVRA